MSTALALIWLSESVLLARVGLGLGQLAAPYGSHLLRFQSVRKSQGRSAPYGDEFLSRNLR
jgi:hypothetical protein